MAEDKNTIYDDVKCCICGVDDAVVLYESTNVKSKTHQELINEFRSSGDEFLFDRVVRCNRCGLVYVNPRFNGELISLAYSEGSDENFVSQALMREGTFTQCIEMVERYAKKGHLLDIGTASGSFPFVAKKRGWDVYALEPSKWLCDWAKKNYNIDVRCGVLGDKDYDNHFFDVVTMWDVLEHTLNPKEELIKVNRILKSQGILVINFPNVDSIFAKLFKRKWWFFLSVHLYYFNQKTLGRLLGDCGYELIAVKRHIQSLSLGYLVFRFKKYSEFLYKIMNAVCKKLNLGNLKIPYYAGQTNIIARKVKEII